MNNYTYIFNNQLYLNITNKCSNNCSFCVRLDCNGVEGNELWLDKEASFPDMKESLKKYDLRNFEEVVFCGFGEPTSNYETLIKTAEYLKKNGVKTLRLNTNGQGSLFNQRNIVPELAGYIDIISISLNASNAAEYQDVCKSVFGEKGFFAMLDFAKECLKYVKSVYMTKVDAGDDAENKRCEVLCRQLGAKFKLRERW